MFKAILVIIALLAVGFLFRDKVSHGGEPSLAGHSDMEVEERVDLAKDAEKNGKYSDYYTDELNPYVNSYFQKMMRDCGPPGDEDSGTEWVVADITESGELINIDFEPRTRFNECTANELAKLSLPEPPGGVSGTLPFYFEIFGS